MAVEVPDRLAPMGVPRLAARPPDRAGQRDHATSVRPLPGDQHPTDMAAAAVTGCCLPTGYEDPARQQLLVLLADAGVLLPDRCKVMGADRTSGRCWLWRIAGARGEDPEGGPVGSRYTAQELAAGLTVTVDADGARHAHPATG